MDAEVAFTNALLDLDRRTRRETSYRGHVLAQMVARHRSGLKAAKAILRPTRNGQLHDGLVNLWLVGRVDLSVEALVIRREWRHLFDELELAEAFRRLTACGYWSKRTA